MRRDSTRLAVRRSECMCVRTSESLGATYFVLHDKLHESHTWTDRLKPWRMRSKVWLIRDRHKWKYTNYYTSLGEDDVCWVGTPRGNRRTGRSLCRSGEVRASALRIVSHSRFVEVQQEYQCQPFTKSFVCWNTKLHKVVQEIVISVLVARLHLRFIIMNVVVHVISLISQLSPLPSNASLFFGLDAMSSQPRSRSVCSGTSRFGLGPYLCLPSNLISLLQLHNPILLFLPQIGKLFDFGLVESVDDFVPSRFDIDALDLLLVFETDLADCHVALLLEIRPWRVYDCDIVLFVA